MEVTLKNKGASAKIISKGAELKSLIIGGRELMWRADPKYWGKTSPLLFPLIGTLKDGKTVINGKEYEITKHGFARDLEFSVDKISEERADFNLEQSDYTKAMFPFDFKLTMRYELEEDGIKAAYVIKNNSAEKMPFCVGAHPAFALDGNIEDYRLEFPEEETAAVPLYNVGTGIFEDNNRTELIKSGKTLKLSHEMFYKDVCYFDKIVSRTVSLLDKENKGVKVDFPDFTTLGVWQSKDAPFICLEPWRGSADFDTDSGVFSEKRGITVIPSGETYSYTYFIKSIV